MNIEIEYLIKRGIERQPCQMTPTMEIPLYLIYVTRRHAFLTH